MTPENRRAFIHATRCEETATHATRRALLHIAVATLLAIAAIAIATDIAIAAGKGGA
jgi:hypothetical protein